MDNEYRPLSGVEVKDNVMLFNLDFDTLRHPSTSSGGISANGKTMNDGQ